MVQYKILDIVLKELTTLCGYSKWRQPCFAHNYFLLIYRIDVFCYCCFIVDWASILFLTCTNCIFFSVLVLTLRCHLHYFAGSVWFYLALQCSPCTHTSYQTYCWVCPASGPGGKVVLEDPWDASGKHIGRWPPNHRPFSWIIFWRYLDYWLVYPFYFPIY